MYYLVFKCGWHSLCFYCWVVWCSCSNYSQIPIFVLHQRCYNWNGKIYTFL